MEVVGFINKNKKLVKSAPYAECPVKKCHYVSFSKLKCSKKRMINQKTYRFVGVRVLVCGTSCINDCIGSEPKLSSICFKQSYTIRIVYKYTQLYMYIGNKFFTMGTSRFFN